jgi:hypothetical protein
MFPKNGRKKFHEPKASLDFEFFFNRVCIPILKGFRFSTSWIQNTANTYEYTANQWAKEHPASSVADPGSDAFLTTGSGIRNRLFPDPGSQTHIFESLVTIFWVKTSINPGKLGQIFFFSISKIK